MKYSFLNFFYSLSILKFSLAKSVTIECTYYFIDFYNDYSCDVTNVEDLNGHHVIIEKNEGEHHEGRINDDVRSLWIEAAKLKYFPSNINNVFKNLTKIFIYRSNMFEITSEDLKVFPTLKYLELNENLIQFIREDTFKHNPKLEKIKLTFNHISHIDPKTFSELDNLIELRLDGNICKFENANNRDEVLKIVKKIEQGYCLSDIFTTSSNLLIAIDEDNDQQIYQDQSEKMAKNSNEKIALNFLLLALSVAILLNNCKTLF
ncbi:hypothetical protein PVAND_001413 [Polypedilum vanderplanki]|uniref:Uncharacterized protein n=1 Tax=Polypedilum vanderplanki TaxID=319348 RepID=A0A9J6BMW5_POLVA|nr:hypothetical protein PVAND_001413 [Polypedilum vanderplanki]